jgi:hypothetical protein
MIKHDQSEALDKCLALLEAGSTLEECLAGYPEYSADLRPLLEVALKVRHVPSPTSSPAAFAAGKQRMLQALAEKEQQQKVSTDPFSRGVEWIAALFKRVPLQIRVPAFLTLVATTALILLVCVGTLLLPWIGGTATQAATLAQVTGTVEVMPAGGDAWRSASVGERVAEGDRLRTDAFSAATLAFFDQSTAVLGTDTEIVVAQMRSQHDSKVIVLYQALGQTYNQVQRLSDPASRFEIETPTAVVGVRGTEFAVTVDGDGATHVMVVEGMVDVTIRGSTVTVRGGQETTVQPQRTPVPARPTLVATPTPRLTLTSQATETLEPTQTPQPTPTSRPTGTPDLTQTPRPVEAPEPTEMPEPDETSEPSSSDKTPQPPGLTKTPQPPGQTRQPQPAPTQKPKPTKKP